MLLLIQLLYIHDVAYEIFYKIKEYETIDDFNNIKFQK